MRLAIVGAGAWGRTLAGLLADAAEIVILPRDPTAARALRALLPASCAVAGDPAALAGSNAVLLATPSHALRQAVSSVAPALAAGIPLVACTKGFERGTLRLPAEVIAEVLPENPVACLSGPNLAMEVAGHQPTASVVACRDPFVGERLRDVLTRPTFRCYASTDVVGVQAGGALKNVVAIAVGMAFGLGYGDNARAALITRGLAEMTRLAVALGAEPMTLAGLAGLGDLVATCSSPLSRNRRFGELLARGLDVQEALAAVGEVVEGVPTTEAALELAARHRLTMPIAEELTAVLRRGRSPADAARRLMERPPTWEQAGPPRPAAREET